MNKDFNSGSQKTYVLYIKGAVIGIIVTALSVLLFALIMMLFETGRAPAAPLATVSVALGGFSAAFYTSRRSGRKGFFTGLLTGITVFLAVTVVSLAVDKGGLSLNTLFHFIIIMLSSLTGAVVGVNKRKNRKYI